MRRLTTESITHCFFFGGWITLRFIALVVEHEAKMKATKGE